MPALAIIIPTYNRKKILLKNLKSIEKQQKINFRDFEVIIVDDGSTDQTYEYLKDNKFSFDFRIYKKTNEGQGIARNFALEKTKADIIAFIGDDIILDSNFIFEHLSTHKKYPKENHAVLGFMDWHKDVKKTEFIKWLTNGSNILGKFGGHQFAYEKLKNKETADYNFFYTSNISLKRKLLEKEKFDPDFSSYGWEDIELGYRLYKKHDLTLHYNKNAIGYHLHQINEESLRDRMFMIGKSSHIIQKKHPELKKVPGIFKRIIFFFLSNQITILFLKLLKKIFPTIFTNLYFYALSKRYFMEGVASGSSFNYNQIKFL